jgi:hypothetical protein
MNTQDKERLIANITWFNEFFSDLKALFEMIAKSLSAEFPELAEQGFYYPKSNDRLSIPPYFIIGLGDQSFAIQVFLLLDITMVEDQPAFAPEPSLIVVKHSRGDKYLWADNYGIRVMRNSQIKVTTQGQVLSGEIAGGEGKGTRFHAFQVFLDPFVESGDTNEAIQTEIVGKLRALPDWQ